MFLESYNLDVDWCKQYPGNPYPAQESGNSEDTDFSLDTGGRL